MDKLKQLFLKYKQFIFFCIVGASNTIVAIAVYSLLASLGDFKDFTLVIFSAVGDIAGAVNSYLWNRYWVFRESEVTTGKSVLKFAVTFGIYLAVSALLVWLCLTLLPINKYLAKIIVLPVTMTVNYLMNKFWTFK